MPVPKRYFHCNQEINLDSELWEFTTLFGDRSIRTWMQILAYLDKSQNYWKLSGDWLGTLSRTVRQSSANCSRQVRHMVEKGWLEVGETSADGSPLVLKGRNWLKYNRSPEHKRNGTNPDQGAVKEPLLSFPTPSPTPTPKKKEKSMPLRASAVDEDFWSSLGSNPAYRHIDLTIENGKMDAWLALPKNTHRKKTQQFVLRWLNKIDRPLQVISQPASYEGAYHKKVVL